MKDNYFIIDENKNLKFKDLKKIIVNINGDTNFKTKNLSLYQQAFTHKSFNINKKTKSKINNLNGEYVFSHNNNEVLELLGDNILKLIISEYLIKRYSNKRFKKNENFISSVKIAIEKRESYARLANKMGFSKYLLLSKFLESNGGRSSEKILEDCFEAFAASLYYDKGFKYCKNFYFNLIEKLINIPDLIWNNWDYKSRLKNKQKYKYEKIDDSSDKYITGVYYENKLVSYSKGNTKKEAEQNAAKKIFFESVNIRDIDKYHIFC